MVPHGTLILLVRSTLAAVRAGSTTAVMPLNMLAARGAPRIRPPAADSSAGAGVYILWVISTINLKAVVISQWIPGSF
jgi:hypothetical protein